MLISEDYSTRLLTSEEREGWLNWSLDFFTEDPALQKPYVDITLQLDITETHDQYKKQSISGSFFSFLIWHFMQILKDHLSFRLRQIEGKWYVIDNPPIFVPVAILGQQRFADLLLLNVTQMSYPEFSAYYLQQLSLARNGKAEKITAEIFFLSQFFGNLPNLQFTGLTLHSRHGPITGQSFFYFGKRYFLGEKMFIPFAAKLHHACADPFVLDLFLQDFQRRMELDSSGYERP